MAWSATMIGALLGLGTQMYSNALRKLPYMRHPWEHLVGMGLGAVFVNQLVKWDAKLQEDLDKMLEKAKAANERRYFDFSPCDGSEEDNRLHLDWNVLDQWLVNSKLQEVRSGMKRLGRSDISPVKKELFISFYEKLCTKDDATRFLHAIEQRDPISRQ
ncbi:unnamed protein product [Citrullus colocynthis]|uniref:Uncharacterized protein n=1 Tax=Citrullus colocynthis TaxID=252529 RepID=A0ABP0YLE0_9ROSI